MSTMKKIYRLTKSSEFKAVYQLGRSFANRLVVLYVRKVSGLQTRAGFVVGRSFGKAVVRNRAKRLLREAYRLHREKVLPGYHLVFVGRAGLKGSRLSHVEPAVVEVLNRSGVLPQCSGD